MIVEDRFWSKVHKDKQGSCWMWRAYKNNQGYGTFKLHGKMQLAHRVAWELERGPIPGGKIVCHRCDTPACCNPDHLFLGTQDDNMKDALAKGRLPSRNGEGNGRARLTNIDVQFIKHWLKDGRWTQLQLAEAFEVCCTTINHINTSRRWQEVA